MTGAAKIGNIPTGVSFLDALAEGLIARFPDPLARADLLVLLPTRRACRSLREAFLRASDGQPLILPQIRPLGDVDDEELALGEEPGVAAAEQLNIPPAMPPLRREFLLTRLVLDWSRRQDGGDGIGPAQAVELARELARLIDQVDTEGLSFTELERLAPDSLAEHWQVTLQFLEIAGSAWPAIQAEEGAVGPAERRRLLLEAQARQWRDSPPATPIIAAGSTGSIPATAALLETIAGLPAGEVVLPGPDRSADEATWELIAEDPQHPQYGLARLLAQLGRTRDEVTDWPWGKVEARPARRAAFVNLALAPAEATADWRDRSQRLDPGETAAALQGLKRIDAKSEQEEALAIALVLREAVEQPGRTAALVTPDRDLARRVASELKRWSLSIDDSAGQPLTASPPATLLRLLIDMVASDFAPVALLAALKHPLAGCGLARTNLLARVRLLEAKLLRGPRPAPGLDGLRAALNHKQESGGLSARQADELAALLDGLAERLDPLAALEGDDELDSLLRRHIAAAEALCATDGESGEARLWAGEAGETLALFLGDMVQASRPKGSARLTVSLRDYAELFTGLLTGQVVRPHYGGHPRLAILGPLEARLVQPDLLVLGGLNEGVWPRETDPGPWLSRAMRRDFGLPPVERAVGLAAHDFVQALGAREVVLTRTARSAGGPSVPSRWLLRLEALMQACGIPNAVADRTQVYQAWGAALDATDGPPRPMAPAGFAPPLDARPKRLSVTQIETWMRDPYAIYARHVLKLRRLDPLDAAPDASDKGILIHAAMEEFVRRYPRDLPVNPEAALLEIGVEVFRALALHPAVQAYWWPRFARIAGWVAEREAERRTRLEEIFYELKGEMTLEGFTLSARADRIERLTGGGIAILDYKTGTLPSQTAIRAGFAPQLPLEAAMAARGAFAEIGPELTEELLFWHLTGGKDRGTESPIKDPPMELAEQAVTGLLGLITAFADPATAYYAAPDAARQPRSNDYAHLERLQEWSLSAPEDT